MDLGTSAMGITNREFKKRRKELMARMEPNSIGLLSSAPECVIMMRNINIGRVVIFII